ncbi:MAG: 50S ribosomal protein L35ae [Nanoarchaeota archaeon]|nr:50S ribosomal protein L35ae [Nanoarchaeota archaeon]
MEAIITSYRRSRHRQYPNQILIKADGIGYTKAHAFLGKKVIVQVSKNKKFIGKIVALHGKKGVVRARFKKGLPGQVIGKKCEIQD